MPSAQRAARGLAVVEQFLAQPEYERATTLMMFLSLPLEIDTAPIAIRAWEDGKRVLAPLVDWEQKRMIPIEIRSLTDDVRTDDHGVRVPIDGQPIPIAEIDLVVVPGIGFDPSGNRLGRGGGFYDRFLSHRNFHGHACALALDEQVIEAVPFDEKDVRVSLIVTDRRVIRARASGANR